MGPASGERRGGRAAGSTCIGGQASGGMLSGTGSMLTVTLLERQDVSPLVQQLILGDRADEEDLSFFHPAVSLVQTLADPADPLHYARMIVGEPRPGFAPKSVLMTEGVAADGSGDSYTPPRTTEIQAVVMGLPPQEPVIHTVEGLEWDLKLGPVKIPVGGLSGNIAGGKASGVLAQWDSSTISADGHFVLYNIDAAMAQASQFLRNLADDPVGRVPEPCTGGLRRRRFLK